MKYEYTILDNSGYDGNYYISEAPTIDSIVRTDNYILYMTINARIIGYDYSGERKEGVSRSFSTVEREFEFTGKWRITNNDSNKDDTKLHVEISHNYIKHGRKRIIEKVLETGWKRLFRKYKQETSFEDLLDENLVSKVWVSEDKFEFRSLFQNECENCKEVRN